MSYRQKIAEQEATINLLNTTLQKKDAEIFALRSVIENYSLNSAMVKGLIEILSDSGVTASELANAVTKYSMLPDSQLQVLQKTKEVGE